MPDSNSLFQLIKSLTKAEKRNFKIIAAKSEWGSGKHYIRLFDAIDAQEKYDEKAIKKKLKKEAPDIKKFSNIKIYLFEQILKSLKNLDEDASTNLILHNYLIESEILSRKGLLSDCAQKLSKAKAIAKRYEKVNLLQEIIYRETVVAIASNDLEQFSVTKKQFIEESADILTQCIEQNELHPLYLEATLSVVKLGMGRGEEEKKILEEILSRLLLRSPVHSFNLKLKRQQIILLCAFYLGYNTEKCKALNNIIELCESHPEKMDDGFNSYTLSLNELAMTLLDTEKYVLAGKIVEKMKAFYEKNGDKLNWKQIQSYLNSETHFFLKTGQLKEAMQQIQKIKNFVEINAPVLTNDRDGYLFDHIYFEIYFINGDFKKAQYYNNKIINYPTHFRLDIQTSARLTNLILQYEQGEYVHLGYVLRSTYRYMLKKERLLEQEMIILGFIKKALQFTNEKQFFQALAKLREEILPYMYVNTPDFIYFPLIDWIDSKLQKRSMAEIARRNYLEAVAKEEAETPSVP